MFPPDLGLRDPLDVEPSCVPFQFASPKVIRRFQISNGFVDVTLAVHQAELVPDPFASLPGLFPGSFFDGFCGPGHSVARVSCEHSVALAETDLKSQ